MGCVISRIHYGLNVVFYFRHFTVFHYHHYSRLIAGTEHINVCRVSCGGVSNMLIVLSITFYFHYNIWGCICSTGPFKYRWLKGYIYSSCYYHHQNRKYPPFPLFSYFSVVVCLRCLLHHILALIVYTFRENREFVFISIVQFMMSANSRIRFGLQIVFVCLYITPSHYHHCANFIWRHWTYEMPVRYNLSSVWVRLSIFSQWSIIQYVGCVFSVYLFPSWWLSYYNHQIGSMNYYPLFRVRSWNNGMRCMSFYILMENAWICFSHGAYQPYWN